MILLDVMNEVAGRLDTIEGLRVYPFPADKIATPAAVVAYPDDVTFDLTQRRGVDGLTLPVFLMVGRQNDKAARDNLVPYGDGDGARSVKAVIESGTYTTFFTVRVAGGRFAIYRVGDVDYVGTQYTLNITGRGATP